MIPATPVQEQHIAAITDIIRQCAVHMISINLASEVSDTKYATDMVAETQDGSIGVRIRTYESASAPGKWYRDLTIRAQTRNGNRTEIHKLRDGFARWYVYAWEAQDRTISEWWFIDMNIMRTSGLIYEDRRLIPNGDGTGFYAYQKHELQAIGAIIQQAVPKRIIYPHEPVYNPTRTPIAIWDTPFLFESTQYDKDA